MSEKQGKIPYGNWTSFDIVVIVTVAAIWGIIGVYSQFIWNLLYAIGGAYAGGVFAGFWFGIGLMAFNMIRKGFGIAWTAQALEGLAQFLLGSPIGYNPLVMGILQGAGMEIGLAIWGYRRHDWVVMSVCAILATLFSTPWEYSIFGWYAMPLWAWLLPAIVRLGTGLPLALAVCIGIPNALQRMGVMLPYQRGYKAPA